MVKIKTKEETTKGKKRKLFLPIFIAAVMILSVFGVIIGNLSPKEEQTGKTENNIEFNGFIFKKSDIGWQTNINKFQVNILNSPYDIEDIGMDIPNGYFQKISKVYISRNIKDYLKNLDSLLYTNLRQAVNTQFACSVDIEECKDLPLKDCEDTNDNTLIVLIKLDKDNKVNFNNNCLNINGDLFYISQAIDRLILKFFGL